MKSLLFFDNSQSTRCHPPKGKIREKNELRKMWINCSSPFPGFFIHTKALFLACSSVPTCTPWQTLLCVTALCALVHVCLGSGSWAATAEAVSANNRLLHVNSAMQTILFVPLHLQSPPLKFRGQPLLYELSKSNVPTFPASNHCRQWGFSWWNHKLLSAQATPIAGRPYQGVPWPFLVAHQPRQSPRVPEHPIPLTELC